MTSTKCIFCQIVSGQIPCYKVYEDDNFLGFLDIRPLNLGNSLLIPKKHYRWVYDLPNFADYWQVAKKIAIVTQKVVKSDFVSFLTLGLEVPHAHIRIIPRWLNDQHKGKGVDIDATINISASKMKQIADKI
ncbi:HIT family protein, partial [Candidatus Shapirobacteria bacterium]